MSADDFRHPSQTSHRYQHPNQQYGAGTSNSATARLTEGHPPNSNSDLPPDAFERQAPFPSHLKRFADQDTSAGPSSMLSYASQSQNVLSMEHPTSSHQGYPFQSFPQPPRFAQSHPMSTRDDDRYSSSIGKAPSGLPSSDLNQSFYDPHHVKHRRRTSPHQLEVLNRHFVISPKPDLATRQKLSVELGMTARSVQVWFQNRRAKQKKIDARGGDTSNPEGDDEDASPNLSESSKDGSSMKRFADKLPASPTYAVPRLPSFTHTRAILDDMADHQQQQHVNGPTYSHPTLYKRPSLPLTLPRTGQQQQLSGYGANVPESPISLDPTPSLSPDDPHPYTSQNQSLWGMTHGHPQRPAPSVFGQDPTQQAEYGSTSSNPSSRTSSSEEIVSMRRGQRTLTDISLPPITYAYSEDENSGPYTPITPVNPSGLGMIGTPSSCASGQTFSLSSAPTELSPPSSHSSAVNGHMLLGHPGQNGTAESFEYSRRLSCPPGFVTSFDNLQPYMHTPTMSGEHELHFASHPPRQLALSDPQQPNLQPYEQQPPHSAIPLYMHHSQPQVDNHLPRRHSVAVTQQTASIPPQMLNTPSQSSYLSYIGQGQDSQSMSATHQPSFTPAEPVHMDSSLLHAPIARPDVYGRRMSASVLDSIAEAPARNAAHDSGSSFGMTPLYAEVDDSQQTQQVGAARFFGEDLTQSPPSQSMGISPPAMGHTGMRRGSLVRKVASGRNLYSPYPMSGSALREASSSTSGSSSTPEVSNPSDDQGGQQ